MVTGDCDGSGDGGGDASRGGVGDCGDGRVYGASVGRSDS
jgi:hypothetical protein